MGSQKTRINWEWMNRMATRWLLRARVMQPLPGGALRRHTPRVGAQYGNSARWDLRGGAARESGPYRDPAGRAVSSSRSWPLSIGQVGRRKPPTAFPRGDRGQGGHCEHDR
jgi:hypothetical protein